MPTKPKLLMVAYYYPPFAEVGVVRVAKFAKYLHKANWGITCLSVKEKYYKTKNKSYIADVKGIKVTRTSRLPAFLPGINEEGFYWAPVLIFSLLKQLIFNKPDVVYFTGGPFYHWLLAPLVKLFGIEYVLDFRDPWKLSPYIKRKNTIVGKLTSRLEGFIEKFAIRFAKSVINVTAPATQMYAAEYPLYKDKFVTITNGYDPDDFKDITGLNISSFDIVYSGKFGTFRNIAPFLEAFKKLIQSQSLLPEDIRFVWVGNPEKHIIKLIDQMDLKAYSSIQGFLPYRDSLRHIADSSLSVLIAGAHPYEPTTKIFDYMALGKRVLGITDTDGFVSETLNVYPLGEVSHNNTQAIYKSLLDNFTHSNISKSQTIINAEHFNRQTLTHDLEKLLKRCVQC